MKTKKLLAYLLSLTCIIFLSASCDGDEPDTPPTPDKKAQSAAFASMDYKSKTDIAGGYKQDYTVKGTVTFDDKSTEPKTADVSFSTTITAPASVENAYVKSEQPTVSVQKTFASNKTKQAYEFAFGTDYKVNIAIERDSIASVKIEGFDVKIPQKGFLSVKYVGPVSGTTNKIRFTAQNSETALNKDIDVTLIPAPLTGVSEKSLNIALLSGSLYKLSYVIEQSFGNGDKLNDNQSLDLDYSLTKPSAPIAFAGISLPAPSIAESTIAKSAAPGQSAAQLITGAVSKTEKVQKFTVTLGSHSFEITAPAYELKYTAGEKNLNLSSPKYTLTYKKADSIKTEVVGTDFVKTVNLIFTAAFNNQPQEISIPVKQTYPLGELLSREDKDHQIQTLDKDSSLTSFTLVHRYQNGSIEERIQTKIGHSFAINPAFWRDTVSFMSYGDMEFSPTVEETIPLGAYSGRYVMQDYFVKTWCWQIWGSLKLKVAHFELGSPMYFLVGRDYPSYQKPGIPTILMKYDEIKYVSASATFDNLGRFVKNGVTYETRKYHIKVSYSINGQLHHYEVPPLTAILMFGIIVNP